MISFCSFFRHEKDSNNEIVPRYSDRLVLDTAIRSRLGPGGNFLFCFYFICFSLETFLLEFFFLGILNHGEDCREAEDYLRKLQERSSRSNLSNNTEEQQQQLAKKAFANQVLYTSVQQAAFADLPWG